MKKFLIADDSSFMRNVMKKALIECGYNVVGEAENGRIAFEKYVELKPDIVTMDITMHEMTGLESLKKIMEYDSNAKIIMVSAMGQEAFVKEAITLGAKGFLVKPFNKKSIASTMARL